MQIRCPATPSMAIPSHCRLPGDPSLTNCTPGTTACGPIGVNSPITNNPTLKISSRASGFAWDPTERQDGRPGGFGMFDVLPLPYEFGLNTAATAPFQIIGADPNATLGTGVADPNVNFNRQKIRNRFIDALSQSAQP